jgi:nucleoid DNA-binding protein
MNNNITNRLIKEIAIKYDIKEELARDVIKHMITQIEHTIKAATLDEQKNINLAGFGKFYAMPGKVAFYKKRRDNES